ncbi:MAG: 5'-methylthioadenosine/S-adenosylhomocysteine nucleosidase [Bacillota bacterium]|jgi:adenosylhomocysteine nucleosidase
MQMTIGILAAMREELAPFLGLGTWEESEALLGRAVYTKAATYGDDENKPIAVKLVLTLCGVGKVRAAAATQALIDRYHPHLILNIGTAGGLRDEIKIGDIVVTRRQFQHDSQLWERYCCDAHPGLSQLLFEQLSQQYRTHQGNGCAGDMFQTDRQEKLRLAEKFDAHCVDMESAAIADTCAVNQVPFCVIRSISDALEGAMNEFEQNYQQVSQLVARAVMPLIGKLAGALTLDE